MAQLGKLLRGRARPCGGLELRHTTIAMARTATSVDSFVAARVRERRIMLGVSQQQLAEVIGVTYQQAQKYEKDINRISAGQLYEIACALNTPIAHFYEGLSKEPRPLTPHERRLLYIARNFVEIQNEAHRTVLCELVRTLAGR
jgi:transcriptional regulator with XRE-family HTH domain